MFHCVHSLHTALCLMRRHSMGMHCLSSISPSFPFTLPFLNLLFIPFLVWEYSTPLYLIPCLSTWSFPSQLLSLFDPRIHKTAGALVWPQHQATPILSLSHLVLDTTLLYRGKTNGLRFGLLFMLLKKSSLVLSSWLAAVLGCWRLSSSTAWLNWWQWCIS